MTPRDDEFSELDRGDGPGEAAADPPPRAGATDLAGADTLPAPATAALGSGTRPPLATAAGSAPRARADATPGVADDAGATAGPAGRPAPLPAGRAVGRYVLGAVLGEGGMGTVYRARDPELGRDVALKVVASRPGKSRDRLLAEARAMAKLEHPNVVPIYDVGATDDGIYLVMPLVAGGTLHDWIHARPRPWREVLARFLAAGRGLAAAHAAGLVHRDFKPRNVLLDGDDVLVADFGLTASDHGAAPAADSGGPAEGSARLPSTIAGTPAYMAPEQARGEAVDARADQYSFCISLWEGLHGQRPTEAETRTRDAALAERLPGPSDRPGAPDWLRTATARGFAAAPDARWRTLAALLDHLDRRLRRPRRHAIGLAAIGVTATVAVFAYAGPLRARAATCPDPQDRASAVWGGAARSSVERAFAATGLPWAKDLLDRVVPILDRGIVEWRAAVVDVCRSRRAPGSDQAILDLRTRCLDRWLLEASGTIDQLAAIRDAASLDRSATAARQLNPVADCLDESRYGMHLPPPEKREESSAIQDDAVRLDLALRAGEKDVGTRTAMLVARARQLDDPPTLLRALATHGRALASDLDFTRERAVQEEITRIAAQTAADAHLAGAWLRLLEIFDQLDLPTEGKAILPGAQAAVARIGSPLSLQIRLLTLEANLIDNRGEAARAIELLVEARRRLQAAGPEDRDARLEISTRGALGAALGAVGRYDESVAAFQEVLATAIAEFGPEHPRLASFHQNIGEILRRAQRFTEALESFRTASVIARRAGDENVRLVRIEAGIAASLHGLGRHEESLAAYDDAIALAARAVRPEDPYQASLLGNRAVLLRELGRAADALPDLDRIVSFHEQRNPGSASLANALHNRAGTARDLGDFERALADHRRALEMIALDPDTRMRCIAHAGLGATLLQMGRPAEAIEPLEIAVTDTHPGRDKRVQTASRWLLGRARVEANREALRGMAEVRAARAEMAAGGAQPGELAEVDRWLASRERRARPR